MILNLLLTSLFCLIQYLHTGHALVLNPLILANDTTQPVPAAMPNAMPRAIHYDIPNTELTLYISDLLRRVDTAIAHEFLRFAIQEAQSSVTRGRGDLPLKPRCWAVERNGLKLQIVGGGPRTEFTARQMSYDILLEVVKGLDTFFSEVEGGYRLLFFYVMAKGSKAFSDGYGFGRLIDLRAEEGQSAHLDQSGCFVDGTGLPAVENSVQVDRVK